MVNRRSFEDYFRETLRMIICQPLQLTNTLAQFDATINVGGGGPTGRPALPVTDRPGAAHVR